MIKEGNKMAFLQRNCLRQNREGLQRADKRKAGRVTAIMLCILMLAIPMAGCGKVEEPIPVDLSDGNMEEMQGDGTGNDAENQTGADAENREDALDGEVKPDADENAGGSVTDQTDTGADNGGAAVQDSAQGDSEQQTQDAQQSSAGSADLEGDVLSVNQDSFVVSQIETWTEGDVSYAVGAAPGYEEEEKRITVHVAGNCIYQYQTVKNGGIDPEDVSTREGSFSDLQEGILVDMKGNWQDDGSFLADSVVMSEIV